MNIEYHRLWSDNLHQDMEFKIYGHAGKPVMVFPAMGGRFYDYENFGMIGAAAWFIEQGLFQFYTVDSVDYQSWCNPHLHPADRGWRHEDYDRYIIHEVIPFIRQRCGADAQLLTTGCSMGGYHSANFFFRHPDVFNALISLSGVLSLRLFVGDYVDERVYFNSPLLYLPNLSDPWYLEKYRRSQMVLCAGQGAWEEEMQAELGALRGIVAAKDIPAWIDLWGHDVNHDWPWWRKMLPYFLSKMG